MADINVDLSAITPSGDGKYYGKFPLGNAPVSGGTTALAWSAPSGLAQGSSISLTTDGTNPFGTGPTQVWYESYSNGSLGSDVDLANTIFDDTVMGHSVRATRVSDSRSGSFAASHFKETSANNWNTTSLERTFAGTTEVFVSHAAKIPAGANFPGNDGGNSGTNADYSTDSSWKVSWLTGGATAGANDICIPTYVGSGIWHVGGNDISPSLYNSGVNPTWWKWGKWHRFTCYMKGGSTPQTDAGVFYFQVANTEEAITEISDTPVIFANGTAPYQWTEFRVSGYARPRTTQGGVEILSDDVYISVGTNAAARVELGDNAVYTSCTDLHIQNVAPADWATGQIDFDIDYGPFSPSQDLWLHITREDNSTKYSIQVSYA